MLDDKKAEAESETC